MDLQCWYYIRFNQHKHLCLKYRICFSFRTTSAPLTKLRSARRLTCVMISRKVQKKIYRLQ